MSCNYSELQCLGLDRQDCKGAQTEVLIENSRIRKLINTKENIKVLQDRAEETIQQVNEYKKFGFEIRSIGQPLVENNKINTLRYKVDGCPALSEGVNQTV